MFYRLQLHVSIPLCTFPIVLTFLMVLSIGTRQSPGYIDSHMLQGIRVALIKKREDQWITS